MQILFSDKFRRKLHPEVLSIARLIEDRQWHVWAQTETRVSGWPPELRATLRLMLAASVPMVMFLGRDGETLYNAAFARLAGDHHPRMIGEPVENAWPELAPVFAHAHESCKNGDTLSYEDYEALVIRSDHAERVWLDMDFSPIIDPEGEILATLGIVFETTPKVRAERALLVANAEFRALADTMPQMVWSTLPNGFHDYYNARWYEFTGMPEGSTDGEDWNGMFHPEDRERALERWRYSLETGEPYDVEYRLRHHSGQYRWTLGRALPVKDANGKIQRWFGTCTDIHDAKVAAAERELIAQELSHRIKNIFSVLNGLISLSARAAPGSADFANQLRTRIQAMGIAHDYVRPHSKHSRPNSDPTQLHALIQLLLKPFGYGNSIEIGGEDVVVDSGAATPVSLFIHELATNASKYGGLSARGKGVRIETRLEGDTLHIDWRERFDNPGAAKPLEEGFGTKLITLTVSVQMNGTISHEWLEDGLAIKIALPHHAVSKSGQLAQA